MPLRWMPIESNPDIMNSMLRELGLLEPWGLTEILSLDPDATDILPEPSLAIILLFPVTNKYLKFIRQQEKSSKEMDPALELDVDEVYFIKQIIKNACGTVALIHAVANNMNRLKVSPNSILETFIESTRDLSAEDRGRMLKKNLDIANLHKAKASEGQSNHPGGDDDVELHFITFVNYRNYVVELDGLKSKPIVHAVTEDKHFVKDALEVIKKYISIEPSDDRYNASSLGPIFHSSTSIT